MNRASGSDGLQILAQAGERLTGIYRLLKQSEDRNIVSMQTFLRNYQSGGQCEFYIKVKLEGGSVVCWFLEVGWEPDWQIQSGARINRNELQESLFEFGPPIAVSHSNLAVAVSNAIDAIESSINSTDLRSFIVNQ